MFQLALKSIRMRALQSICIAVTVAVSVAVFVGLIGLYGGLQKGVTAATQQGGAQAIVVPTETLSYYEASDVLFTGAPLPIYLPKSLASEIEQISGVSRTTTQFFGQTLDEGCCSTGSEQRIIGIDPSTDWVVSSCTNYDVKSGLADDEVIVGSRAGNYKPGETIQLLGQKKTIVAVLDETGTDLDLSILLNENAVRDLMTGDSGFDYLWEKYGAADTLASVILLDYTDESKTTRVNNAISKLGNYTVIQRSELVEKSANQLSGLFLVLTIMGIAFIIIAALQLLARFFTMVLDRKNELALYRALGATPANLRALIGSEAGLLVGAGTIIGIIAGIIFETLVINYLQGLSAFPFISLSVPEQIIGIVGVVVMFFLLTVLAIAYPLSQVGKIDPATAIQQSDIG